MIAILGLVALSVPGSLYPGLSFGFMTRDFLTTILMAVLIVTAIREF
jgi:hypothetical protein